MLYQVYRAVFTCGRNSRTFGWLFSGGMTAILLFAIGLYVLIDYVLRDILSIPVVSSVWDEALLLFCVLWIIWERKKAASPIAPKFNPLDLPVAVFLTVCFVLLCVVCPYTSIQIAGFRATCQYLLWFYLVTRLIRNDRDCMTLYLTLVSLSFVLSLHGIYQYITKAPMPSNWVAQAETAVRTRVYSIFGSPNIMGDFMVLFVPMTAALAYYAEKPSQKAGRVARDVLYVLCVPVYDVARRVGRDGGCDRSVYPARRPQALFAAGGGAGTSGAHSVCSHAHRLSLYAGLH